MGKHMKALLGLLLVVAVVEGNTATAADLTHGKSLYEECAGCHAPKENQIGPKHCGVVGRMVGTEPGFVYSDVMRNGGFRWDDKHLDAFLTSPLSYLSGTNMGYAGLYDAKDRQDLIAYLKELSRDPLLCGPGDTASADSAAVAP
jgi:cytochrome c